MFVLMCLIMAVGMRYYIYIYNIIIYIIYIYTIYICTWTPTPEMEADTAQQLSFQILKILS